MAKKKRQGHYCKICGETKANEKFSGKGHANHICKKCQSLPKDVQADMMRNSDIMFPFSLKEWKMVEGEKNTHDKIKSGIVLEDTHIADSFDDLDNLPIFSEKKKIKELDKEYKTLLREYIYKEIMEYMETHEKVPAENELIEIRKQMIRLFEEEYNITLKSDPSLRQFFGDNVAAVINKLQKKNNNG